MSCNKNCIYIFYNTVYLNGAPFCGSFMYKAVAKQGRGGNQTSLYGGLLTVYGQLASLPEEEKPGKKTGGTEFTVRMEIILISVDST